MYVFFNFNKVRLDLILSWAVHNDISDDPLKGLDVKARHHLTYFAWLGIVPGDTRLRPLVRLSAASREARALQNRGPDKMKEKNKQHVLRNENTTNIVSNSQL